MVDFFTHLTRSGHGAWPCTSMVHRGSSYTVQRSTFLWLLNAVHCTAKFIPLTAERCTRTAKHILMTTEYIFMTAERFKRFSCTSMVHHRTQTVFCEVHSFDREALYTYSNVHSYDHRALYTVFVYIDDTSQNANFVTKIFSIRVVQLVTLYPCC